MSIYIASQKELVINSHVVRDIFVIVLNVVKIAKHAHILKHTKETTWCSTQKHSWDVMLDFSSRTSRSSILRDGKWDFRPEFHDVIWTRGYMTWPTLRDYHSIKRQLFLSPAVVWVVYTKTLVMGIAHLNHTSAFYVYGNPKSFWRGKDSMVPSATVRGLHLKTLAEILQSKF